MNVWQVQAQLTAVRDGWESSRQVDTMLVAAPDEVGAVRMVSDMAWSMSGDGYADRRTYATAALIVCWSDHTPFLIEEPVRWVRVDYTHGQITCTVGHSYTEVKEG